MESRGEEQGVIRRFKVSVSGKVYEVAVEEIREEPTQEREYQPAPRLQAPPRTEQVQATKKTTSEKPEIGKGEVVVSPMPAKVVSIRCQTGGQVKSGDILLVIEAMKMEHNIFAPRDGVIVDIKTTEGASVAYSQPLVVIG